MANTSYSVRLSDKINGRVLLIEVVAANVAAANSAALALAPAGADWKVARTVDDAAVLGNASGRDTNGNPIVVPTVLPVTPDNLHTAVN